MVRDLLNDLPSAIIETILMRMPIRDAIKTSLLSSEWRYKWTAITELVFDANLVRELFKMQQEQGIVKFIDATLIRHKGPIHKFELTLDWFADVHQWILHLSRNGIKELTLVMVHYTRCYNWDVPSCLFSCDKLTHLELHGCKFHTPKDFKGFSSLKRLALCEIMCTPAEDIQFLICSSPSLETLSMTYVHVHSGVHIDIEAPRLKCLTFEGRPQDIILVNTPLLASFSVFMSFYITQPLKIFNGDNFGMSLGAMPPLERLVGSGFFTMYLSLGYDIWRISLSVTYSHLTVIELSYVRFQDIKEVKAVIRLLIISPILHTLTISASEFFVELKSRVVGSWDKESVADSTLERLHVVKLANLRGSPNELLLVEFLLKWSPVLQTLKISTLKSVEAAERDELLHKLMRFGRTSARAQIILLQEPNE